MSIEITPDHYNNINRAIELKHLIQPSLASTADFVGLVTHTDETPEVFEVIIAADGKSPQITGAMFISSHLASYLKSVLIETVPIMVTPSAGAASYMSEKLAIHVNGKLLVVTTEYDPDMFSLRTAPHFGPVEMGEAIPPEGVLLNPIGICMSMMIRGTLQPQSRDRYQLWGQPYIDHFCFFTEEDAVMYTEWVASGSPVGH